MPETTLFTEAFAARRAVIIAEIGVNHNGDMGLATRMIDAARDAGADAVKFQMFRSEDLVTETAEKATYQKTSGGANQLAMLKPLELSQDQHRALADYCARLGITYLCTPYDLESARFLTEALSVAAIKVASTDSTNIPFLRALDRLGRPVILSTGMCTMAEVRAAVAAFPESRAREALYLLQCTSEYPAPAEESNLRAMVAMEAEFGCPVGFSDHTVGTEAAGLAVACGARIIEKHFTLDRTLPGPDHRASSDPTQFAALVRRIREIEVILGSPTKTVTASERANKPVMQKSIYYRRDLLAGTVVTEDDLAFKRPAAGLLPGDADKVVGRQLTRSVAANQLVGWDDMERAGGDDGAPED